MAWRAVHGLASLLIEEQIMAQVDIETLMRKTSRTVLAGMLMQDN